MRERQLALFINLEQINDWAVQNQVRQIIEPILFRLEKNGKINIRKAYANWSSSKNHSLIKNLIENGVHPIQIFDIPLNKENPDSGISCRGNIQMALDILETIIQHEQIDTIALVTVDGEYRSLVSKLQEYGRMVFGIGPRSNADLNLVKTCDRYLFLDEIVMDYQQTTNSEMENDARYALEQAISEHIMADNLPVHVREFKQTLLKIQPNFNEKALGFKQFTDYLINHQDLLSTTYTEERDFLIDLPRTPAEKIAAPDQTIKEIPIVKPDIKSDSATSYENISDIPNVEIPANAVIESSEKEFSYEENDIDTSPTQPVTISDNEQDDSVSYLQNPFVQVLLNDIQEQEINGTVAINQESVQQFTQEGMRQSENSSIAADNFRMAARLQWECIQEQVPGTQADDLAWMLASYSAYYAGSLSQNHQEYKKAEAYYLAHFAIMADRPDLQNQMDKLCQGILKQYWLDIGRDLSLNFDQNETPENILLKCALHQVMACRKAWIEKTARLARANPAILKEMIQNINQSDHDEKNRIIELIKKVIRSEDAGILEALASPFLDTPLLDIFYFDKSKTLSLDRMSTIELGRAGDRERQNENFPAAAKHFLEAAAIQWKLIEMRDEYSLQVDLNQYVALYSVVKAKEHFNESQYELAEPYHLAYFTLVQENGPLWKKLGGLIVPTLMDYWITAAGKSKVSVRNMISPVKVAIEIATHPDSSCRENWRNATLKLANANPSLLQLFSKHIRTSDTAPLGSKRVANQIEAIVEEIKAETDNISG